MDRQVCFVSPVANSDNGGEGRKYSILERAPISLPSNNEIWEVLRGLGREKLVIDELVPSEAFKARIAELSQLDAPELNRAMWSVHRVALDSERKYCDGSFLAKNLDQFFDGQREWLQLRALLARAKRFKKPTRRALMLIG